MVVGQFSQETDLVVIGGGPAGYIAAFRAAELGVSTVIVDSREDGALGGVCLHDGCIPSKTLLHIAELINQSQRGAEFGITLPKPKVDFAAVRAWKDQTIKKLAAGLEASCKKHGVERITGRAHFEDSRNLGLLDASIPRIRFKRALIATGSHPKMHATIPFDGQFILTASEALAMQDLPKSLLIIGGDYQAMELATIYAALGCAVSLVHEGSQLLPEADPDLVRPLTKQLEKNVVAMHIGTLVRRVEVDKKGAAVAFGESGSGKPQRFDRVVITAGHIGNTRGLQLEKTQIKIDAEEFIAVDSQMRTANPRIFSAGDVTGAPLLADKAIAQGRVAAEVIAGRDSVFDARCVPVTIFTDPQLAWCGVTETHAKNAGIDHAVSKVPWGASGRAAGMGRSEGMTKIIYEPGTQLVLGVGLVGTQACEMIAQAALAIEMGATLTDLAQTIHPHPTMSELLSDAARKVE